MQRFGILHISDVLLYAINYNKYPYVFRKIYLESTHAAIWNSAY